MVNKVILIETLVKTQKPPVKPIVVCPFWTSLLQLLVKCEMETLKQTGTQ